MKKRIKSKFNLIKTLFIFLFLQIGVNNIAYSQQDIVTASRLGSACDSGISSFDGYTSLIACSISFYSPVSGGSGVIWMKNDVLSFDKKWRTMSASDGASYSLQEAGIVSKLGYLKSPTKIKVINGKYDFPIGYYIVQNSTGLYWAVFLGYRSDYNLVWSPPQSQQFPWQVCSPTDNFRRDIGCYRK